MQENYFTNCFLKKNIAKDISEKKSFQRKSLQGTSNFRKDGVVKHLCPLMPESRRPFYENLLVCVEGNRCVIFINKLYYIHSFSTVCKLF